MNLEKMLKNASKYACKVALPIKKDGIGGYVDITIL